MPFFGNGSREYEEIAARWLDQEVKHAATTVLPCLNVRRRQLTKAPGTISDMKALRIIIEPP